MVNTNMRIKSNLAIAVLLGSMALLAAGCNTHKTTTAQGFKKPEKAMQPTGQPVIPKEAAKVPRPY